MRRGSDPKSIAEMRTFSGRTIDVPSMFVGGKSDWGVYQTPGAVDKMRSTACTRMVGFHLLEGAGHWVQQEQPEQVSRLLIGVPAGPTARCQAVSAVSAPRLLYFRSASFPQWPGSAERLPASGRGIPAGGVAPPLHTPGMLGRRAWPSGRRAPESGTCSADPGH